jgi:hypothetical protein
MESDQAMVAIYYLVSSFSGAIISFSPAPHFWTLHLQSFSIIFLLSFKINQTQKGHKNKITAASNPLQSSELACIPLQGCALTPPLQHPCSAGRIQSSHHP